MKKVLLSFFVITSFALYVVFHRGSTPAFDAVSIEKHQLLSPTQIPHSLPVSAPVEPSPSQVSHPPAPSSVSVVPPARTAPPIAPKPAPRGMFADGVYTGRSVDAYYGNIQVRATIQNGKIVTIDFLDYPHDRSTSIEINTQAMPYLRTEAIQAQSAKVDIVSGATDTSGAFQESLASALAQAGG